MFICLFVIDIFPPTSSPYQSLSDKKRKKNTINDNDLIIIIKINYKSRSLNEKRSINSKNIYIKLK